MSETLKQEPLTSFLSRHRACHEGTTWALGNCATLDEVWAKAKPDWLVWVATRPGVLTCREVRLLGVVCARALLACGEKPDPRSLAACQTAEDYANGKATHEALVKALEEAELAARQCPWADVEVHDISWLVSPSPHAFFPAPIPRRFRARVLQAAAAWLRKETKPNFSTTNTP
jgi:hypothetical protein